MKSVFRAVLVFLAICSESHASSFVASSAQISPNKTISEDHVFNGFGCAGQNISPQISWKNAPKETKSFAVTVYDPDAPTGSGWWHWLVVNIPASKTDLSSNFGSENKFNLADGSLQIRNDYGVYSFGGPCPPKGDKAHRYIFTVHALSVEKLDLSPDATAALAGFMINHNSLAKAKFTAFYGRK